jgi:type II secretory pathway predicted ATPase ExeA
MLARRSIGPQTDEQLERVLRALADVLEPERATFTPPQQEALSAMASHASVQGGGMGLLTGAHGAGKSLLVARLASEFERAGDAVVVVESGLLEFEDLLLELTGQLTSERPPASVGPRLYDRLALFKSALLECAIRQGRRVVAFFDDADSMSAECLARVATLGNLRSAGREHVMPVLVGTGTLRLNLTSVPSAASRIGTVADLRPLAPGEAAGYLLARLAAGGVDPASVLEPQAIEQLHPAGLRTPRRIDSACRAAARGALPEGRRISTQDLVAAGATLPDAPADRGPVFGR